MAIPSRQIGWGTESNLLWQILKQLNKLTSVLFGLKEAATPNYKVYTALLTQSGGSSTVNATSGLLIVGVSYDIDTYNAGDDFSNVGGPAAGLSGEWDGYSFLATGTTPNNWNNSSLLISDEGAPVATVLENTIGNIWFTYEDVGIYSAFLPNSFDTNKIFLSFGAEVNKGMSIQERSIEIDDPYSGTNNQINFFTNFLLVNAGNLESQSENNQLLKTPIEIRVYN